MKRSAVKVATKLPSWDVVDSDDLDKFLKKRFNELECVKEVNYYENFLIPYGIYQLLPEDVAKGVTKVDKHVVKRHEWLASTVYWELYF